MTAIGIAYSAILISRHRDHYPYDSFEAVKNAVQKVELKHFFIVLGCLLIGSVYMTMFAKNSPKLIGNIALNMIVYFYVFKAIKDLSRIFFK